MNFQILSEKALHKLDFCRCKTAIMESASRLGQGSRISNAIADREGHSLLFNLQVDIPRYMYPLYLQVITGCDFLTPFDHTKKPDCPFCKEKSIGWEHLMFRCSNCVNSGSENIRIMRDSLTWEEYDEKITPKLKKCKRIIFSLFESHQYVDLMNLCLALNLSKFNLAYKIIIERLVKTVCPLLYKIKMHWEKHTQTH